MGQSALTDLLENEARIAQNLALRADCAIAYFTEQVRRGPALTCPICKYTGRFAPVRHKLSIWCPSCDSRPRHRLLKRWLDDFDMTGKRVLHFAPEVSLSAGLRETAELYRTADTLDTCDFQLDITAMDLPDGAFDVIIANHVLEYVDDQAALAEMRRVLAPDGLALLTVPLVAGWARTFENPEIEMQRAQPSQSKDAFHLRFYGRDFSGRVADAGFVVEEFTASVQDVATYALHRGETLFIARKQVQGH